MCWVLCVGCVGVACGCFGSLGQILCAAFGLDWGCSGAGFGVAGACVVIPCLRSYACWAGLGVLWCWLGAGLGSVGGIATIGAALRRVVGVSGVYGRKTPRGCLEGPASRALSVAVLVVFGMSSCVCRGGVACLCWWLGGNCYHRRCLAACRRRVGALWSQNPPRACSKCSSPRWYAGDMGCLGCSGRRVGRGCVSVWCCGVCEGGAGGVSVGEAVADV